MKLTIGMPHWNDFSRCSFTIEQFLLNHSDQLGTMFEIVVADNSGESEHSKMLAKFVNGIGSPHVRVVNVDNELGPSGAKNAIFQHALGNAVLVMDCHVLLHAEALRKLVRFFDANSTTMDLYHGPNVMDDGKKLATHWEPKWSNTAWGQWAADARGAILDAPPFEIWGSGCGLFACRRSAWLGFDPRCRGFGGAEEGVIHEKFRKAGRKVWCLPFLRWWHAYNKVEEPKVPNPPHLKVTNYLRNFIDLGLDVQPIYDHFVQLDVPEEQLKQHMIDEHALSREAAEHMSIAQLRKYHRSPNHKINPKQWQRCVAIAKGEVTEKPPLVKAAEQLGKIRQTTDIAGHLPRMQAWARESSVVCEVTRRPESTLVHLAGLYDSDADRPRLRSYVVPELTSGVSRDIVVDTDIEYEATPIDKEKLDTLTVEECDYLFVKGPHNWHGLEAFLVRNAPRVRRLIAIHDTQSHMLQLDDRSKGYGLQVRDTLEQLGGAWFVSGHWQPSWGLTLLSRDPADRPGKPIYPWPIDHGPGTELKKITDTIGIKEKPDCSCNAIRREMDIDGVDGCRKKRDEYAAKIKANAKNWSWLERIEIAAKAVVNGIVLGPIDPYGSLVDMAIERAERMARAQGKTLTSQSVPVT